MEELIKKYLYDKSKVNQYINLLKSCEDSDIIKTRSQINKLSVACRLWQLQYCMLYLIYKLNISLLDNPKFLNKYCENYKYIITLQNPITILNDLILNNNLISPGIEFRTYRQYGNELFNYGNREKNYFCCIYGIDKRNNTYLANGIFHYFTLILNDDNKKKFKFYITSSYGSDHVCIPYQINKLNNFNDIFLFAESLKYIHNDSDIEIKQKSIEIFTNFMIKYFLSGGIKKKYGEDDIEENPSLRYKMIQPKEGLIRELEFYINNDILEFDIAVITNYENLVKSSILERSLM